MQKRSAKNRKGNPGRTSNEGRKLSSGGTANKPNGSPERDENTGNQAKEKQRRLAGSKGIT